MGAGVLVFSASTGYNKSSSEIATGVATGESVFIYSTAKCVYYFSKLIPEKASTFEFQHFKGVDVTVQVSYDGLFSISGDFNMDSTQQEVASNF